MYDISPFREFKIFGFMDAKSAQRNKRIVLKDLKMKDKGLKAGDMTTKTLTKKPLSKKTVAILGLI